MTQRIYYIDRLRVLLTFLVVLHHAAITYGAAGGWFYYELHTSGSASSILLTSFCATNQAFFMGFFFLLAGYFTPGSYNRKGPTHFLCDRLLRLGLPLLFFILVLAPLTVFLAHGTLSRAAPSTWWQFLAQGNIIPGPLWFAEALLLFSLAYMLWRALTPPAERDPAKPLPSQRAWWLAALGTGLAAFLVRMAIPVGKNIVGLQIGYFVGYIFLFALGCAAWRGDWLNRVPSATARLWSIVTLCAFPWMPFAISLAYSHAGKGGAFTGGWTLNSLLYALWEPLVAWGIMAALTVGFRHTFNRPSRFWEAMGTLAYTIFILHPPVLVGIALLLHPWQAPPVLKFLTTGSLAFAACALLAVPLVRIPGLRRVL